MDESFQRKILALLDQHRTMRIATLRPDGWPQVTTVGYANDGFAIYFLCGPDSQKPSNLARDDRVSPAIDDDPAQVMDITGLSMAARTVKGGAEGGQAAIAWKEGIAVVVKTDDGVHRAAETAFLDLLRYEGLLSAKEYEVACEQFPRELRTQSGDQLGTVRSLLNL